ECAFHSQNAFPSYTFLSLLRCCAPRKCLRARLGFFPFVAFFSLLSPELPSTWLVGLPGLPGHTSLLMRFWAQFSASSGKLFWGSPPTPTSWFPRPPSRSISVAYAPCSPQCT